MPLYNNILPSKRKDEKKEPQPAAHNRGAESGLGSSRNASMKLLQDHLQSKRRLQHQNASTKKTDKYQKNCDKIISEHSLHKPSENDWNSEDEYNPMVPNSYEVLQMEYLKAKEKSLLHLESQQASKQLSKSSKRPKAILLDVIDKLDDDEISIDDVATGRGTAIAPPPSLNTNTASQSAENDMRELNGPKTEREIGHDLNISSAAARIMSKMGYNPGQGLGKNQQGVTSCLDVGRVSKSVSFQDQSETEARKGSAPYSGLKQQQEDIKKLPHESSRIVLLQNMVGPGEVDDDLEAETNEECKKYGRIIRCLIYEIPNKKVPDDEAVRIFVEFEDVESALNAVNDLNGRYFGGRTVKASFYSLDKFNKYELGPARSK